MQVWPYLPGGSGKGGGRGGGVRTRGLTSLVVVARAAAGGGAHAWPYLPGGSGKGSGRGGGAAHAWLVAMAASCGGGGVRTRGWW